MAQLDIAPLIRIFISWCGLFWVFSGIGLLLQRACGLRPQKIETLLLCFWPGWAIALSILQLWHFWFKVDGWALLLLTGIGVVGLIWNRNDIWQIIYRIICESKLQFFMIILIGLWLANRATGTIPEVDTGLYHLTNVKWISTYPIVSGLGNLHGRLAFNSSFFLYAAVLNIKLWTIPVYHLANGLLFFVLLAQTLLSLAKLGISDGRQRSYYLYYSLMFIPIITATFDVNWIPGLALTNLYPDVPIFILGIILSGQVWAFCVCSEYSKYEQRYQLVWITLVACAGIVIKLSFVFLAGMFVALSYTICLVRNISWTDLKRFSILIAVPSVAILVPWGIRGIFLSGYLLYPSTIVSFPVEWKVPRALVLSEANWIKSWGRQDNVFWSEVLHNSEWLQPWLNTLPSCITIPLGLTLMALLVIIPFSVVRFGGDQHQSWFKLMFFIPPLAALVLWFILAPNVRFAGASFWIVAVGSLTFMADSLLQQYAPKEQVAGLFCYILFMVVFIYVSPVRNPLWFAISKQHEQGLQPLPVTAYQTAFTDSGLMVYLPVNTDQCWDAPLPCTPYFRSTLRLREKGNVRKGFVLDKDREFVDIHGSQVPEGFTVSPDLGIGLITGWYPFEPETGVRWMCSPARIVLYSEREIVVNISLTPYIMNTDNTFGKTGTLIISVNNEPGVAVPVTAGDTSTINIQLRRDFNVVQMEFEAGNFVPAETIPGYKDERSLSIAFSSVHLVTESQPNYPDRVEQRKRLKGAIKGYWYTDTNSRSVV